MSESDSDSDFQLENVSSGSDSENFESDDENLSDYSNASFVDENPAMWNMMGDPFADIRPDQIPEYLGIPGPNPDVFPGDDLSFTRSVDAFLPEETFNFIVQCTNTRAQLYFANQPQRQDTVHGLHWRDVTVAELKKFFGYLLNMGLNRKPQLSMYWSTRPNLRTPWFLEKGLSRNRFLSILKFIRFADPNNLVPNDRLCRIRPFLDRVENIFQHNYQPTKNVVVDESLMLYKGRLHFRQYIKSKRSRFGVKIFSLCTSDGYMYSFDIYIGQGQHQFVLPPDNGNAVLSLSERIVVYLGRNLLDLGYSFYTDNWYTSTRLAEYLLTRDTLLTGTIRPDRGVPDIVRDAPLHRHQTAFARKENLMALKYLDKRDVYLLSSEYTAELTERERFVVGGQREFFRKPTVIQHYTRCMRGVDKLDQLLHSYNCCRKSYRWFKKVGIHFVQRALINSHFIYKEMNDSNMTLLTYLNYVIEYFVDGRTEDIAKLDAGEPISRRRRRQPLEFRGQPIVHTPSTFPPTPRRQRPQRRCVICSSLNTRRDTRYFCSLCPSKPALCMPNCFSNYNHGH